MRVLRTGGEFTAMQMWKQRLGIVLGIAGALAIAAASALFWHPAGALLGLVLAVAIARPCYRRLVSFQKGAVGPRWTPQNRPYVDGAKPAIGRAPKPREL